MFLPSRQHAALGVLHSPHTQPNLPSAPDSHLSSSNSMPVFKLLISLLTMLVASYAHVRSLIRSTRASPFAAKFLKKFISGAEVSPPRLPFNGDFDSEFYVSGTLTAPLASPNSHLLVSTATSLFDWPLGSDSWSELQLSDAWIVQIVELNGQFIAMDDCYKIYTLQLSPQLGLQEITTEWIGDLAPSSYAKPWLVVCGNMLLMVSCFKTMSPGCSVVQCIPHHLDMSTNPAKWVEVNQLDNWALFVGGDVRSMPFSCMSPERWGGRSKWLYYAGRRSFIVHGVGDERDPSAGPKVEYKRSRSSELQPLWVYPSTFYSDAQ